jgi:hypothetical protein
MSSKRKIDRDYTKYPGSIDDGIYKFPILYSENKRGDVLQWQIFIKIVNTNTSTSTSTTDNVPATVPVTTVHYTMPDTQFKFHVHMWTKHGIQYKKIQDHSDEPTIIKKGNNLGRSNETNAFTLALYKANSLYNKKIESGSSTDLSASSATSHRLPPMLLHKKSDHAKKLHYPVYGQYKYDGQRAIVTVNPVSNKIEIYSRTMKVFEGLDHIEKEFEFLKGDKYKTPSQWYIDGELYIHGKSLQYISGQSRSEKKGSDIEYFIYDMFIKPDEKKIKKRKTDYSKPFYKVTDDPTQLSYVDRKKFLFDMCVDELPKSEFIHCVPTIIIKNDVQSDEYLAKALAEGYEGTVERNSDGVYETAEKKQYRTYNVLKRKPRYTKEFICVDFKQGVGKAKGAITWICKTDSGIKFAVDPKKSNLNKGTYKERKELFIKMSKVEENGKTHFENHWNGKDMTIEYDDLSEDGVPLRLKSLGFREEK